MSGPSRVVRRPVFFLLLQAGLLAPLSAQQDPLAPPDLSRYLKWGPIRARPGFAVPYIGYDDNVFSASGTTSPQGDYAARLSPRIEGLSLFGTAAFLTFKERMDYTLYASHSSLNYFENLGSARVTFPLRRMGFYADGALNRLRDPPASELDSRPIRTEVRIGAGVILKLGWRTDAEIGWSRSRWKVTDDDFLDYAPDGNVYTIGDLQNRVESGGRLKLRYRVTGVTRLTLETWDKSITFDDPQVARNSDERVLLPGVELGGGGTLSGSARLGWARLDALTPGEPDYSGAVGETKLAWRVSSATTLRLESARLAGFAVYQGNRYYQNNLVEARVVHYFNRVFGFEAGAGRGRLTFPESPEATARTDRIERFDAGLRLRLPESTLGKTIEYTFGLTQRRRNSSQDSLDQSRAVVGFGASVGF